MAMIRRVLGVWCVLLLFVILLVVRLEKEINWNWFIVFIPFFVFDVAAMGFLIFRLIQSKRNGWNNDDTSSKRKFWVLVMFSVKLTFLILLGCKLQQIVTVSYYVVFIPLWILLLGLGCDVSMCVWKMANSGG